MKLPLEIIESAHNPDYRPEFPCGDKTAIHSGRLGDVIYSLPTVRMLGINHLVLNVFHPSVDDRRIFTLKAIRQLRPLLLSQPYIKTVSISSLDLPLETVKQQIEGVDYVLDRYRNVPRHKIADEHWQVDEQTRIFSRDRVPVHLTQCFAISQGLKTYPREPWLFADPATALKETTLVSLTPRWRSFPQKYWHILLNGLRDVEFIGLHSESFNNLPVQTANDHLELARKIAGCRFFLGTISFPYSIAEALKVNRAVEVCHFNLNAYPIGEPDRVLKLDVLKAREQIADLMELNESDPYRDITQRLKRSPSVALIRTQFWAQKYKAMLKHRIGTTKLKLRLRTKSAA